MRLAGKVALITGTSPNIGGGIAEMMADEGAKVVCIDARPENANECAKYIRGRGGQAIGAVCDVTNESQVKAAVAAAKREFGGIDVLVSGAVVYNMKGLLEMTVEEFRRQIDIILAGAFLFSKNVAQVMIEQARGGSIINIASTEGYGGNPHNIGYCTGKSGLLNFTRATAVELAPYGIRVNTLVPVSTDPTEAAERGVLWGRPREDVSNALPFQRAKLLPLQAPPKPSDYAQAAVFLASDESRMVTGSELKVDAGALAKVWFWQPEPTPAKV